jgi:hypothetical protein
LKEKAQVIRLVYVKLLIFHDANLFFDFSPAASQFTVEASEVKLNSLGKQKKKCGRKGNYLTASELNETMKFYYSNSPEEKQRILQKYGHKKIKQLSQSAS